VAFDHDCREGICGSCSMMINGRPHGPERGTATCQLHLRKLPDGATVTVEPWRAAGFPIIRDLVVDRSAFDRIVEAGGYITAPTGSAPDANEILIPKEVAGALDPGGAHGGGDGALVRVLHEPRGVRDRLPEGDFHRLHRPAEPRLREGAAAQPGAGRAAGLIPATRL
jgi:hypothetical protein